MASYERSDPLNANETTTIQKTNIPYMYIYSMSMPSMLLNNNYSVLHSTEVGKILIYRVLPTRRLTVSTVRSPTSGFRLSRGRFLAIMHSVAAPGG